jgi:exonuclease V
VARDAEGRNVKDEVAVKVNVDTNDLPTRGEPAAASLTGPSPIQQFRISKNRPLSVSDIVSPSWCELQYWFSLTKYGRIKRTPAMKRGTTVHRQLELEVHDFVPIDIQTREDGWGLRLWNVIQGLRTLRTTGMTRELDIWGVVDGEVVSGIIDEMSHTCTDPEKEATLEQSKNDRKDKLPEDQKPITDFFSSPLRHTATPKKSANASKKVYITDTKTRTSDSLPSGASLRPTKLQLMLYRHLLTLLCTNQVPADKIFARYGLNREAQFSDSFIAAIADLEFNSASGINSVADDADPFVDNSTTFAELLDHPTLEALWNLMIREYERTLSPERLSPILNASFRSQRDGTVLGNRTFAYDDDELQKHISAELKWWRGERLPRGVDVEEAFKCRICEFAENCHWRIEKEKEARAKTGKTAGTARRKNT